MTIAGSNSSDISSIILYKLVWNTGSYLYFYTQQSQHTQLNHGVHCFAKPCRHQDDEENLYHGAGGFLTSMRGG